MPAGPSPAVPGGWAAYVVLAGGSGQRFGADRNKVYLPLAGRPVISWSLALAAQVAQVGPILLVARPQDAADAADAVAASGLAGRVETVPGGRSRMGSELAALERLRERIASGAVRVVAVHDGARPLASPDLLRRVLLAADASGGAVPTLEVDDVWQVDGAWQADDGAAPSGGPILLPPPPGARPHRVQTPQAFRAAPLLAAYEQARTAGLDVADTAGAVQHAGLPVVAVAGDPANLKITMAADLPRAAALLSRES
jgi:2-C-methyl-D-erythritol 4-phosphate cytidylyltransferase